jgi:hypothetical protein
VTATAFAGDGSGLTNLPSSSPLEIVSSGTFSNDANLTLTNLDCSSYIYQIEFHGVVPSSDRVDLKLDFSTNNGSSFISSNYYYDSSSSSGTAGLAYIAEDVGSASGEPGISGIGGFYQDSGHRPLFWIAGGTYKYNNTLVQLNSVASNTTTTAVNAIRFYFTSGNLASGSYVLSRKDRP